MDDRLRRLDRAAAQGDAHEQARLLVERVRAGELSPERLLVAAYCGHAPASLGCTLAGMSAPVQPAESRAWASGLREHPKEVSVRGVVAIARSRLPDWEPWSANDRRPAQAIHAAEAWLACPCEMHARWAEQARGAALAARDPLISLSDPKQLRDRTPEGSATLLMHQSAKRAAYTAAETARAAAAPNARAASACLLNVLGVTDTAAECARAAIMSWALSPGRASG